ncbi:MAG: glycerophosphodiester phosphodiesterase family protein [Bacteroidetes bacterium]|nr:glycerophosphodiester phosphodiesterase family protein [Bacteroidota bacterium]
MIRFFILLSLSLILTCKNKPSETLKDTQQGAFSESLLKKFRYTENNDAAIISVHRGGSKLIGYPENCLETLKYVNDSISAIFEIDVSKTSDDVLVLMHDKTLERTTTGINALIDYSFQELQGLNLVDDFGNETNFKIPKFVDVLRWAVDNEVILTVDTKRGVDITKIIAMIEQEKAVGVAIIITYDVAQALQVFELNPNLLLSVSARNLEELNRLMDSDIPTQNMLAFTGTRLSPILFYEKLHELGVKIILGTLGNLDKMAAAKGDSLYMNWRKMGVDIIATDRPFEAARVLSYSEHHQIESLY